MSQYLIFNTEGEAWNRSEEEGAAIGLSYHECGSGSKYVSEPLELSDGTFALNVDNYTLTSEEEGSTSNEEDLQFANEDLQTYFENARTQTEETQIWTI